MGANSGDGSGTEKTAEGQEVIVTALPQGFIDDLTDEDQRALIDVIGRPVVLRGHDEDGKAEIEFTDQEGTLHTIYLDPKFIKYR